MIHNRIFHGSIPPNVYLFQTFITIYILYTFMDAQWCLLYKTTPSRDHSEISKIIIFFYRKFLLQALPVYVRPLLADQMCGHHYK